MSISKSWTSPWCPSPVPGWVCSGAGTPLEAVSGPSLSPLAVTFPSVAWSEAASPMGGRCCSDAGAGMEEAGGGRCAVATPPCAVSGQCGHAFSRVATNGSVCGWDVWGSECIVPREGRSGQSGTRMSCWFVWGQGGAEGDWGGAEGDWLKVKCLFELGKREEVQLAGVSQH